MAPFLVACYATPHPAMSVRWLVGRSVGRLVNWLVPFLGSGPKGVDDLCFHTYGEFSPPPPSSSPSSYPPSYPSLEAQISVSRPNSQSRGPNPSLMAQFLAWRLRFGPRGWDSGLETGIWASRLGFEGGTKKKKEEEEEKIPHMCESIGHRPLSGRCPKRLTLYLGRSSNEKTAQKCCKG